MKKVAIIVDDYKLPKFREALGKASIVFTESTFTKETTALFMLVNDSQVPEIANICQVLEINFKQSN